MSDVLNRSKDFALSPKKPVGFIFDENMHKNGITIESPPKETSKYSPEIAKIWNEFIEEKKKLVPHPLIIHEVEPK